MSAPAPGTAPRTLADQLRGWSDDALARLLRARPDLATPTPQDTSQLASRAGTRASVMRAVDQLTRLELTVLDAALALGGTASVDALRAVVHAEPDAVDAALDRVRGLALLWGDDDGLRALSVLSEVVGTRTSGLGASVTVLTSGYGPSRVAELARAVGLTPSGNRHDDVEAVAAELADPARVTALLAEVDDQARAILEHLAAEGKDGTVASTEPGAAGGPADQLLARGLLVARDRTHVSVPREVAICLRDGHTTIDRADLVPELATSSRDSALVDRAAAGAAFELVRHVELLLEHWGTTPPSALRTGGLGVRELKAAAELLHADERTAALHIEVAFAADLLAAGTDADGGVVPQCSSSSSTCRTSSKAAPAAARSTRAASRDEVASPGTRSARSRVVCPSRRQIATSRGTDTCVRSRATRRPRASSWTAGPPAAPGSVEPTVPSLPSAAR